MTTRDLLPHQRFEAHTKCPKCGTADWHWLRAYTDYEEDVTVWFRTRVELEVSAFGGGRTVFWSEDEPRFWTVIRTCRHCSNEWGQM